MTNSNQRQQILIVEDHPASRKLLQDILEKEFKVYTAKNGKEAIERVHSTPIIDLILLDIIMPEMDGFDVCKQLKKDSRFSKIPIIFLTVMGEERDEAKGFAAGVSDYIVKPISRLRLLTRIRNQLMITQQQQLLEQQNNDLTAALEQIKALHGILPICSFCKQIRNDDGYWQQLEEYIQNHSSAEFSHSICPTCIKKHYSEYEDPPKD